MNYLLKIVEGPNQGAEVALVSGLCITVGKEDTCDIVLADPTLPDGTLQLEAGDDGVSLTAPGEGRRHLEPFHVTNYGSTAFAIGPADSPWPALIREKPQEAAPEQAAAASDEAPAPAPAAASESDEKKPDEEKRKSGGGKAVALVLLLLILALLLFLGWFYRGWIVSTVKEYTSGTQGQDETVAENAPPAVALDELVQSCSLSAVTNDDGRVVLSGNFATRAERLAATAKAYAAVPGIELDFADAQSLKSGIEDTFALVGEKELKVDGISGRVATLSGRAKQLRRTLEAIASDVPKLENVDCSAVTIDSPDSLDESSAKADSQQGGKNAHSKGLAQPSRPELPVCGILTSPYPCLVLKSGARVLEGAPLGNCIVEKIEPDAVIVSTPEGRVVWKP